VRELLDRRRAETGQRIQELQGELARAEELCNNRACVYMTGSFARGEASVHSDLDLFIAGYGTRRNPALSRLDEILVKADLIETTKKLGLPEFSGDGQYLTHHSVADLVETLGKPEDDINNTFTARLLLLLESVPLLGPPVYGQITRDVIAAYWKDYEDHKSDFVPAFLGNDILRMWRTFCVNYEARTQSAPPEKKAKRKLKNYKLKHSRLLTCYSALLYLLAIFLKNATVSPTDAVHMISLQPTQRLDWLASQPELDDARLAMEKLIGRYEEFLANTDASEEELVVRFMDKQKSREYLESAYQFGDLVYEALDVIGKKNRFYRLLVV
jgi:predicted nucleotidyltransferase